MLDIPAFVRQSCQTGGSSTDMKRVSTRDFLRNINDMTEPVQVFSRNELKGTWLPGTKTWASISSSDSAEEIEEAFRVLGEQINTILDAQGVPREG